ARMRLELPDAALLDIYLPGISGLDFLQLKATRESRIPIVAISGMAPESQARECVQLGAVDFLPKPIELERLREVLACLEPHARRHAPAAHKAERRRAPRAAVAVPVRVVEDGGVEWEATSVDLSAVGVRLRANGAVNPGPAAKLSVALPDGDGALEVVAALVRSDGRGYAFDFVNPTPTQFGRLREFVERRDAADARAVEPHFRILRAISRALSLSLDVDHMLRIALDALTRVTGHETSCLHLLSDDRATLRLLGDRGLSPELREAHRVLPVGQGVSGWVASTVGKLAAGLVHEMNNPLTVILGQAELVMTELADSTRGRERVRIIMQETSRVGRLLQRVLQLSQPQPSERRPCAVADQVRWVLELKRDEFDRDEIRIVTEIASVPSVYADLDQGRLRAESGPDGGAAFIIELPYRKGSR